MTRTHTVSTNTSPYVFRSLLETHTPFRTYGHLKGVSITLGLAWQLDKGALGAEYHPSFLRADYAVYSYRTPIAWHDGVADEWCIPNANYSPTTSRHQNKMRAALHDYTES
jgi:hypothetical protein